MLILAWSPAAAQVPDETKLVELGKQLFFDPSLSVNGKQSCASCHDPAAGFTGPDSHINSGGAAYPGAIPSRFGNRKPPTAAYNGDSPELDIQPDGTWKGGMFADGRATGWTLHDPLAEQAQGPFLNPLEHALPDARQVTIKVANSAYAGLFKEVWGPESLNFVDDVDGTYARIARSIAAYERSAEVSAYTSKFDLFWDNAKAAGKDVTKIRRVAAAAGSGATAVATIANGSVVSVTITNGGSGYLVPPVVTFMGGGIGGPGMGGGGMGGGGTAATAVATVENGAVVAVTITNGGSGYRRSPLVVTTAVDPNHWQNFAGLGLSDVELQGLAAFNDPLIANCSSCHSLAPAGAKSRPLFTDFSYHNIGVPKNPQNPFYHAPHATNPEGRDWVDYGLGGYLQNDGYSSDAYAPEMGKFRTPTLRNVDRRPTADFVKAYGHNGFFKSLPEIIFFYAWRGMMDGNLGSGIGMGEGDMGGPGMGGGMGPGMGGGMDPGMGGVGFPDAGMIEQMRNLFPAPEVDANRTALQLFHGRDQYNINEFLKTLSDGYVAP